MSEWEGAKIGESKCSLARYFRHLEQWGRRNTDDRWTFFAPLSFLYWFRTQLSYCCSILQSSGKEKKEEEGKFRYRFFYWNPNDVNFGLKTLLTVFLCVCMSLSGPTNQPVSQLRGLFFPFQRWNGPEEKGGSENVFLNQPLVHVISLFLILKGTSAEDFSRPWSKSIAEHRRLFSLLLDLEQDGDVGTEKCEIKNKRREFAPFWSQSNPPYLYYVRRRRGGKENGFFCYPFVRRTEKELGKKVQFREKIRNLDGMDVRLSEKERKKAENRG